MAHKGAACLARILVGRGMPKTKHERRTDALDAW